MMEGKALQDLFLKLLRSGLNGTELDGSAKAQVTPEVLSALYTLSNRHDLAHMAASALHKSGLLGEDEISEKFRQKSIMALYRQVRMQKAFRQICDTFDEKNLPYIPLKGSVLRPYYPEESMRTSCDIDILVKEEDLETAVDALVQKGFQRGQRNYHDISLFSPNQVHLELHFHIQEHMDNLDAVLKDAWQYAVPVKNSCYGFTEEFFLFHMFAHMSYHFLSGGCGIRSIMDIWIMKHKMGIACPQGQALLKKAGIDRFAMEMTKLAEVCFGGAPGDGFSDILLWYLLNGGIYGTRQNKIRVMKSQKKSTLLYAVNRVLLPYNIMVIAFPILKKVPILLPFCWIFRFFKMLFSPRAKTSFSELKTANAVSDRELDAMCQIRSRLGL